MKRRCWHRAMGKKPWKGPILMRPLSASWPDRNTAPAPSHLEEKQVIAVHEAGHALIASLMPGSG